MKRKQDIIENVTVVFKHGGKQLFDVIKIVKNGIYIGQFNTGKRSNKKFEEHSFIPHDQIKKIIMVNAHVKKKEIEL